MREIIYLRGRSEVMAEAVSLLESSGLKVRVCNGLQEVIDSLTPSIVALLVDASSGENEAGERVVELTASAELFSLPLVLLCPNAALREEALNQHYKVICPVDFPCNSQKLVSTIAGFISGLGAEEKPESTDIGSSSESPEESLQPLSGTSHIKAASASNGFGGAEYAAGNSLKAFDDNKLLPEHPKRDVLERALRRITETDQRSSLHVRRVTFAASEVSKLLEIGPSRESNVKTVCLVLNWHFITREDIDSVELDLLNSLNRADEKELLEGLSEVVEFLTGQLEDELAAKTLQALISIIKGEPPPFETEVIEDAEIVLVSEVVDRAAWFSGHWNPFGVYHSLRFLRGGGPFKVSQRVADMGLRFVGEAVSVRVTLGGVFLPNVVSKRSTAPDIKRANEEAQQLFENGQTKNIDLAFLMPGMRLARPLIAIDGTVILPANVLLDAEMICRLLQLSAIRPIRNPAIISKVSNG